MRMVIKEICVPKDRLDENRSSLIRVLVAYSQPSNIGILTGLDPHLWTPVYLSEISTQKYQGADLCRGVRTFGAGKYCTEANVFCR